MGDFYCKNCDIHKEYPNLDTALEQFDHAIAIRKGRMCPNNNLEDYHWDGMVVALIKHPEKYPTNPAPKLVPRADNTIKGDSIISRESMDEQGYELQKKVIKNLDSPNDAKIKPKTPKTRTK